jgi:RNA polymerase sigma-70 factor (ECF subfamily)
MGFDFEDGESRYTAEPAHCETPEKLFEKRWARTMLNRSMDRLRAEMRDDDSGERFKWLSPFLTETTKGMTYKEVGDRLNMTEGAVKGAVHRMRKRFGRLLREEVAHTVADPDDVEKEIRYLFTVMVA